MTQDEFTRRLPPFAKNSLSLSPPFRFNGISVRVFPLRANMDALQQVCDGCLNIVPPETGRFRAMLPYVYLMVLDYGQLAASVGWFSQVEVYFMVPVEWYKLVNGQWVFHDWACFTPYIFVNDRFSVPLGRTVYGFNKILCHVDQTDSEWIADPLAPVTLARISTKVFPEAYSGAPLAPRVFLEVERQAPMSNLRMPFDPCSPVAPWTIASNLAQAMGNFGRDGLAIAQSLRMLPIARPGFAVNPACHPALLPQMLTEVFPYLVPGGPGWVQNSLNLKQFRRADHPDCISYQSLTNGPIVVTAFNAVGLLGEDRTLLGDLSGGHTITLSEPSSLPIVRTLGLQVETGYSLPGANSAVLKPVMPFWMDLDMVFERGTNLAWRTPDGIWKDETGEPIQTAQPPDCGKNGPPFSTAATTAIDAIAGPFVFSGTTIRVLPLLAHKDVLQQYLDDYLNVAIGSYEKDAPIVYRDGIRERLKFSVWSRPPQEVKAGGPPIGGEFAPATFPSVPVRGFSAGRHPIGGEFAYVYLTASSFSGVTSGTNNVGDWASYELAFMIPIKLERWKGLDPDGHDMWETAGAGMVPALTLLNDCIPTISRVEVQGIDAYTADFMRPESVWLSGANAEFGINPKQTLLRVNAEVFPTFDEGQKTSVQPVIEISMHDADVGFIDLASEDAPWMWAEMLRREQDTQNSIKANSTPEPKKLRTPRQNLKVARALALELLGNRTPFALYTLKQFRDVTDPGKACSQALVRVSRSFDEVFDVREIEETLTVRIYDYPDIEIVKTLGLVAAKLPGTTTGIVFGTQAVRPFFIQATVSEPLPETLMSRAGIELWELHDGALNTYLSGEQGSPGFCVDKRAETQMDQVNPYLVSEVMYAAGRRRSKEASGGGDQKTRAYTAADAREAISVVDPQMVIASVLSREWGSADGNARWRQGQGDLLKSFAGLPGSGDATGLAESVLYRQTNNQLADRPGSVASRLPLDENALERLESAYQNSHWDVSTDPDKAPTADLVWTDQINEFLEREYIFTRLRLRMERALSDLAPVGVLGIEEFRRAIGKLSPNQAPSVSDPATPSVAAPSFSDLLMVVFKETKDMWQVLKAIQSTPIVGEDLDTGTLAEVTRLRELNDILTIVFTPVFKNPLGPDKTELLQALELGRTHLEDFRDMVALARKRCDAQRNSLLIKLSRAFQKPDFCILRNAAGADCNRLLPLPLSWDQNWYYGKEFDLSK